MKDSPPIDTLLHSLLLRFIALLSHLRVDQDFRQKVLHHFSFPTLQHVMFLSSHFFYQMFTAQSTN